MLNYTSENGSLELSMHLIGEELLILPERLCAPPIFIGDRVALSFDLRLLIIPLVSFLALTINIYALKTSKNKYSCLT